MTHLADILLIVSCIEIGLTMRVMTTLTGKEVNACVD